MEGGFLSIKPCTIFLKEFVRDCACACRRLSDLLRFVNDLKNQLNINNIVIAILNVRLFF